MAVATKRIQTYVISKAEIDTGESFERFRDTATVTGVAVINDSDDLFAGIDADIVTGQANLSFIENWSPLQLSTVVGIGVIEADEFRVTPETGTVTGVAVISHTELLVVTDSGTAIGLTVIAETDLFAAIDAATVTGVSQGSAIHEYDDASSVIGLTVIGSAEATPATDLATITGVGVILQAEGAQFVDGSNIANSTYPSPNSYPSNPMYPQQGAPAGIGVITTAVQQFNGADTATVIGVTQLFTGYADAGTATGLAVISALDNYTFPELLSVTGVAVISSTQIFTPSVETASVIGVGIPSQADNYNVVDGTVTYPGDPMYPAPGTYPENLGLITGVGTMFADEQTTFSKSGAGVIDMALVGFTTPSNSTLPSDTLIMAGGFSIGMIGSGAKTTSHDKGGSGISEFTASGAKSHIILNQYTGYAAGGNISGATNATPIVLTVPLNHGIITGDRIKVSGVGGNTAANGLFKAAAVGATTISLTTEADANVVGNGAYTSGGVVFNGYVPIIAISTATNASPTVITTASTHTYSPGDIITIVNALGNTAINGTWTVNNDANYGVDTFTISDRTGTNINGNGAYTASSANVARVTTAIYVTATTDFAATMPVHQRYT